jgi:hypothetical protein
VVPEGRSSVAQTPMCRLAEEVSHVQGREGTGQPGGTLMEGCKPVGFELAFSWHVCTFYG